MPPTSMGLGKRRRRRWEPKPSACPALAGVLPCDTANSLAEKILRDRVKNSVTCDTEQAQNSCYTITPFSSHTHHFFNRILSQKKNSFGLASEAQRTGVISRIEIDKVFVSKSLPECLDGNGKILILIRTQLLHSLVRKLKEKIIIFLVFIAQTIRRQGIVLIIGRNNRRMAAFQKCAELSDEDVCRLILLNGCRLLCGMRKQNLREAIGV